MPSALAYCPDLTAALARKPSDEFFRNVSKPFHRLNNAVERSPMSSDENPKTLRERVRDALWRRINAGAITRKQLQHAIGVSAGTIDNLLNGNNDPSMRVFMLLLAFFDAAFCQEMLGPTGCIVVKLGDAREAAMRKIAEGSAELKALG